MDDNRFLKFYEYNRSLFDMIPSYYRDYLESYTYIDAVDSEFERYYETLADVVRQLYISTTTWAIGEWENLFGVSDNANDPIDLRRRRIMAMMKGSRVSSAENLEDMINGLTGIDGARLTEDNGNYAFFVNIPVTDSFVLSEVSDLLELYKPAHLSYLIQTYIKSKLYLGSVMLNGEETTIYPYTIEAIEVSANSKQGTGYKTQEYVEIKPRTE